MAWIFDNEDGTYNICEWAPEDTTGWIEVDENDDRLNSPAGGQSEISMMGFSKFAYDKRKEGKTATQIFDECITYMDTFN